MIKKKNKRKEKKNLLKSPEYGIVLQKRNGPFNLIPTRLWFYVSGYPLIKRDILFVTNHNHLMVSHNTCDLYM